MHKFELGIGQDFPLDEASPEEGCGRRYRRHHHYHHHHGDARYHHNGGHGDGHHLDRMTMLSLLFALKDYRRRMRGGEGAA